MITKQDLIDVFGTYVEVARIVGVTKGAVSQWPDPLPASIADRVIAGAYRAGIQIPESWIKAA